MNGDLDENKNDSEAPWWMQSLFKSSGLSSYQRVRLIDLWLANTNDSRLSYNLTHSKYLGRAGLNGTLARQTSFKVISLLVL